MMKMKVLFFAALLCGAAHGQYAASASGSTTAAGEINGKINHQEGSGAPTSVNGTTGKDLYTDTATGILYLCTTGGTPCTWTAIGAVSSVQGQTGAVTLFNPNPKTTTYQVLAADFNSCKVINVASGTFTITLVASGTQPASGRCLRVLNYGSGVVTVARSGQNINGGTSSLTIAAASATAPTGAFIVSDGTDYFANTFGFVTGGTCSNSVVTAISAAGAPTCTLTPVASGGTGQGTYTPVLVIASGSGLALNTASVAAGACETVVTATATGAATTDRVSWTPNADWSAITGYGAGTADGLIVYAYATANTVNFKACNGTGSTISSPGAASVNWAVTR